MDDVTAVKMNFRKEQWKQLILERQASGLKIKRSFALPCWLCSMKDWQGTKF